jgi:hypothetical protein
MGKGKERRIFWRDVLQKVRGLVPSDRPPVFPVTGPVSQTGKTGGEDDGPHGSGTHTPDRSLNDLNNAPGNL